MNKKLLFSVVLVLICITLVFAQKRKNTLAERKLYGDIAQRTVKRYHLHGNKTSSEKLPYREITYTYNRKGNAIEARDKGIIENRPISCIVKFEYANGNYMGYTKYDSLGKMEETGKVKWLTDTTYVIFVNGTNITDTDTTWLHRDYSISR